MPAELRINELVLVTPENRFPYRFERGINAVVGEVGSGKSSLLELIKYGFGGNGVLTPAVQQGVRRILLSAHVGPDSILLEREIPGRSVRALEADGSLIEELVVGHSKQGRNISSFLLERLDLPELRVTNVRPTKKSQPLSFFDIYSYCYVSQAEIDRSVVNHLESVMRAKRVGAFEVLLGLTDDSVSEARVRLGILQDQIQEAQQPLATVDRFLENARTPTEEELHRRREARRQQLTEATSQLEDLRSQSLHVTSESNRLRDHLATTAREAAEVAQRVQELEAEAASRRHLAAELASDLAGIGRAESARGVLGAVAYRQCPRCFQEISTERVGSDRCYVCTQEEPPAIAQPEVADDGERTRIAQLQRELAALDAEGESELEALFGRQRTLQLVLEEIEAELDRQTNELVSPRYEAIEAASSAAATARVELEEIERLLSLWAERERYRERVLGLEVEAGQARLEIEQGQDRLVSRRQRVVDLSDIFDEIIQELQMPWYDEGAYIDRRTYLPIVNGVSIEDLGSGGMKMMTNVAYHLALLTYGLSENLDSIPNLLVIDSPRKNLGTTPEDQAHAAAFYRWISALTRAYDDRFQLIIADNDPPSEETPLAQTIKLSHEHPLVRDLEHPGGDVVTIGG